MPTDRSVRSRSPQTKPLSAYHHGDLRAALIGAAREALKTTVPEAITMKSLALRLGVSQPAPYRHFPSRDALLAAVATDGFQAFRQTLAAAAGAGSAEGRAERTSLAYLAFGRTNLGVYRLMFGSRITPNAEAQSALSQASSAAFDFLLQSVSEGPVDEDAYAVAIWVWSTLHGMVMLEADGLIGGPNGKIDPEKTAEAVVRKMAKAFSGLSERRPTPDSASSSIRCG